VRDLLMRFMITVCLLGWGAGASATLANTDSRALEDLLAPISSLRGTFDQTVNNEQGVELQRLRGTVSLKKPGQFRWEVLGDEPRLLVSDGKKVWDYDEDLDQVTIQRLNRDQSKTPIFFLTGAVNSLDKDFKVKQLSLLKGHCLQKSDICFELTPKGEEGSFLCIKIGFKNKQLKEMEFLDQLGQRSQFIFKNVDLNPAFSKGYFHFVPPPGVDILQGD
jgi:outer membrane lipoprotein carrier protein